jgi:hypothetical protein
MPTGQKGQEADLSFASGVHATIMIVHRGLLNIFMSTLAPTATDLILTLFVVNANGVNELTAVNLGNCKEG